MSVDFDQIVGSIGPTGPIGDIGPIGITGSTGARGTGIEYSDAKIGSAALASYYNIRCNRFGYCIECTNEANQTAASTYTTKDIIDTAAYYGTLPSGLPISAYTYDYTGIYIVYFRNAQTIPTEIRLNRRISYNDVTSGTGAYPVYINNQKTSATNPLLWRAGSIIAFTRCNDNFRFFRYLGNATTANQIQSLPFYRYSSAPAEADLPVRPCFYYVAIDNGWYYCNGLA